MDWDEAILSPSTTRFRMSLGRHLEGICLPKQADGTELEISTLCVVC